MYWVVKTRKIRHRLLDIQFQLLVFLFQNVGLSLIVVAFGKCMLAFQKKCLIIFFAVVLLLPGNSYGKTWVMTKLLGLYHNVAYIFFELYEISKPVSCSRISRNQFLNHEFCFSGILLSADCYDLINIKITRKFQGVFV